METAPDLARLRVFFEQEGWRWVVDRLSERASRGRALRGVIVNQNASAVERRAVDDLLGRRSTAGVRLSVDLGALEETLRLAQLASSLEDVLLACRGQIPNRRAEAEQERRRWGELFDTARARLAGRPSLLSWLEALQADGSLKRMSGGDVEAASRLLDSALQVVLRFPCDGPPLASLAADCTGDSHALDRGQPLAALCLRAIHTLHGVDGQADAEARRVAWEAVGVVVDDLSAPALTYQFRAAEGSAIERILALHREAKQPAFLSYRLVRDHGIFDPLPPAMRIVFVCENPSVISAAARELGDNCRPILCTNGQPASAVRLLLQHLRLAGAELRCHADFDWAGLRIVDRLVREHGAAPWRMQPEAYLSASASAPLSGPSFEAPWSPDLSDALRTRGTAVFEEQVLGSLLQDLAC